MAMRDRLRGPRPQSTDTHDPVLVTAQIGSSGDVINDEPPG